MLLDLAFDLGLRWWLDLWFAPHTLVYQAGRVHSIARSVAPLGLEHLTNGKAVLD